MFSPDTEPIDTAGLAGLIGALGRLEQDVDDSVRIDRIRMLEELKAVAAAAQARETAAFAESQCEAQRSAGVPEERVGRGIASQIGLARRISPFHAQRYVGWASILTRELPAAFAALRAGRTTEWRAMIVARETAWLSREHRAAVDAELAPRLESLGDRRVEAEAKKLAYRLDPEGALAKVRGAHGDRRVTLRPAPDTMAWLTGLVPVEQGVAAYTALGRDADALRAQGDHRSRAQLMADLFVERLTGQAAAGDVPVEVNLVMSPETLLGESDEPAHIDGGEPVPAGYARELIATSTLTWIRRLFTRPGSHELITMETRRRCFTATQRAFIRLRDQQCRTPYCDAPIRHTDHVVPSELGGPTAIPNGQGYCQACNHAKQAPGWRAKPGRDGVIETITPTGHRYRSRAPDPPGAGPERSSVERRLVDYLWRTAA